MFPRAEIQPAFGDRDDDFAAFERILAKTLETRPMRILAYCLLPNHWHLLVWPQRDGDLDAEIIIHEYGHGVSQRLGAGVPFVSLHTRGMGEGWSDWWGLMFTQVSGNEALGGRGIGTYVLGQPTTGQGIRTYRYSYDMAINPLTLGRYNQNQAVHFAGTIWCTTLWDLNWLLIQKYGYNPDISGGYTDEDDAGNILALRLVMDGLKLQPLNPSFLQARNAILAADTALTGGANQLEIWSAFARRGYGFSAVDGGSSSNSVTEAFDIPNQYRIQVSHTVPANGSSVPVPFTNLRLIFTRPFDPATIGVDDLQLSQGTVTAARISSCAGPSSPRAARPSSPPSRPGR